MTTTLTPKFKVGDAVKLSVCGDPCFIVDAHVRYTVNHPVHRKIHREESALFELSTEEQAKFKKEKTEELKKNMLAAIAEYEAFLKN